MQPAATSVPGRATLLNFFSRPGRAPVPLRHRKQQGKKKSPPPQKTRTNVYGRPKTAGNAEERRKRKVNKLKAVIKIKKADGSLAVSPEKRAKWNGSVSICFLLCCEA